jgi:hypothetical protein
MGFVTNTYRWFTAVRLLSLMALCAGLVACESQKRVEESQAELTVTTRPEGAQIFLNEEPQGTAPITLREVAPGPNLIEARRTGYQPAFATVNIFPGQRAAHDMTLEPLHALLLIESDPEGAEVVMNDAFRGHTPLMLADVPFGTHRIRLQSERHFPRELTVTLDDRTPRHVFTELVSDSAVLVVSSTPPGATLRIDGASFGETPLRAERVRTGEVNVELALEGFMPYQRPVRLRAGEEFRVDAQLIPLPTGLTVYSTPPGAQVYIDNVPLGVTPVTITNLAVGQYEVRVDLKGYHSQSRTVDLASGTRGIEEFRMENNSGTIMLVTEPAGVQVHLNGELRGTTESADSDVISKPLTIDMVEAGEYRLQLTRPGYRFRPKTITIEANQMLSLHERLTRMFIPDTRIRTGDRPGDAYTGVLVRKHPNGDVDLETRPGIIITLSQDEIVAIEPLRVSE